MRKVLLLLVIMSLVQICEAQHNPRPTRSRFYNSKHSTFQVKPGDILVYSLTDNSGKEHDFIVNVASIGDSVSYNYEIPGVTKGKAILNSIASTSMFIQGDATNNKMINDINVIWLQPQKWRDLASLDKRTQMNFGTGVETFNRVDASTQKIKYKGKQKLLTVYNISSENTAGQKTFTVLTDENNPLIVSMNSGVKLTLKEVR